jgi:hypothetical protein
MAAQRPLDGGRIGATTLQIGEFAGAAAALSAAVFQAARARADWVFDGSGSCDLLGCRGIVTGVLPLPHSATRD